MTDVDHARDRRGRRAPAAPLSRGADAPDRRRRHHRRALLPALPSPSEASRLPCRRSNPPYTARTRARPCWPAPCSRSRARRRPWCSAAGSRSSPSARGRSAVRARLPRPPASARESRPARRRPDRTMWRRPSPRRRSCRRNAATWRGHTAFIRIGAEEMRHDLPIVTVEQVGLRTEERPGHARRRSGRRQADVVLRAERVADEEQPVPLGHLEVVRHRRRR